MSYFHPIKTVEDRERMLQSVLVLQTQIRAKRKKERLVDKTQSTKYAKIFEPITRTSKDIEAPSNKNKDLLNTYVPTTDNDLVDLLSPEVKKEVEEESDPGELYRAALKTVSFADRDDGTFGLNTDTGKIGDYTFSVNGDILKVTNKDGEELEFEIDDWYVWLLLLAKAPGNYMALTRSSNTPSKKKKISSYVDAVESYIQIANKLHLLETAEERGGKYYKKFSKFRILNKARSGSGFLFSIKPPPFVKPSTVVIPSDNKGLMRELVKALSELRAGNTSMRNLVVPLAQEARRKKILPKYLLEPDEETWVFA